MALHHLTTHVALAGISGKLGRLIAKHLLANDSVVVHGIARHPDRVPEYLKSNPRVKLFKSDMTYVSSLRDAVRGCSILISCIVVEPAAEITMQKAMIDACIQEHVPRFMPNEFTLDWRCIDLDLLPPKKVNQEIFEYLGNHEDKIKGVHVLVGAFIETLFSYGYWCDPKKSPAEGLSSWGNGDDIWEMTSYDNAAEWTAHVALDPEATGYLRFLGDRLTLKEVAQTLQEAYDIPPVPFTSKGSLKDLKEIVRKGIDEDEDSKNFWDWKGQAYTLFLCNGHGYLETPLDNANYADTVQSETLEIWLQNRKLEDLTTSAQQLRS